MTYAEEADIEGMYGYAITSNSFPTSTDVAVMLSIADSIINAFARVSTNMTDDDGYLKTVACNLVYKMINNALSLQKPKEYGPMLLELTEEEKTMIRLSKSRWTLHTFNVGE